MSDEKIDQLAKTLSTPTPRTPALRTDEMLSTGCTVLNCAFSGRANVGVPMGTYLYVVGASGSSKTWLTFNLFAEAARNNHFKKYRFVHDNAENGALMDVAHYFGESVLDRLESPHKPDKRNPRKNSATVQEFYMNLTNNVGRGPCIYVLDSMDAINDTASEEIFDAELKKFNGKSAEIPGSMGMEKAKTNSRNLNRITQLLEQNGSILVIISQTRDAVGSRIPGMQTRGGGRALKFFAHLEMWTKVGAVLSRTYHRREREYGSKIKIDVQKNRVSGWEGSFEIDFIKGYGIDDIGTNIDYLVFGDQ